MNGSDALWALVLALAVLAVLDWRMIHHDPEPLPYPPRWDGTDQAHWVGLDEIYDEPPRARSFLAR